jgi:hypothetical protein
MTRQLPSKPSLEHLRKEAKAIHKAHQSGDPSCCATLKHLHQFKTRNDTEILQAKVGLQEVQFALALEYRFRSWTDLKRTAAQSAAAAPAAEKISLHGHEYSIVSISPGNLATFLPVGDTLKMRHSPSPYTNHANPLYNLHCDFGLADTSKPEDVSWSEHWANVVSELSEDVGQFSLVALAAGESAGHIRFLPASLAQLRWISHDWNIDDRDTTLLICAAYVDLPGAEDSLDSELLRRAVQSALARGCTRVLALAWSDIRAFAMWGESFPLAVYEAAGFRKLKQADHSPAEAFADMLAGAHGEQVQRMVREAQSTVTSPDKACELWVVEKLLNAN